jgi:hypothetical protein
MKRYMFSRHHQVCDQIVAKQKEFFDDMTGC